MKFIFFIKRGFFESRGYSSRMLGLCYVDGIGKTENHLASLLSG
jgi:hypothetical protein